MEIKMIDISKLKPYEKNPRHNDAGVDALAESIKQFGFKVPIVIDENMVIVAGHTRLKAALKLKLKQIPCVIADNLSNNQIKAFRLADNKISEMSEWDYASLFDELDKLKVRDINMETFGFEDPNINWDRIEEISENNYEEPETDRLRSPICGGTDEKIRFRKV
ncbi:MAG: ParB N-terminal domain-containing protein [Clostridiaceae bacterium]|nr:ParB N-terminal domain-containing protein [Clostridiaceae bacterium]